MGVRHKIYIILFLSSLVTACGQNGSHAVALPEAELYRLQPGEMVLAASENDIPAIQAEDDYFVQVEKVDLEDTDLVVGLLIGSIPRAYPVHLLSLHEVVNDRVGERSIAVTWCPLCYSAVVFDRIVDEVELSFQASGYLLHNNLVLIDHQTNTLWSQLLGQGIKGAQRGSILKVVPSTVTTWEIWSETYPDTWVLSAEKLGYEGNVPDPYGGYFSSGAGGLSGVENADLRLPSKELVIGVVLGDTYKAYPLDRIREKQIIADQVGEYTLSIVWDEKVGIGRVFLGDIMIDLPENGIIDFELFTPIPSQLVYWFAWTSFHPETSLY